MMNLIIYAKRCESATNDELLRDEETAIKNNLMGGGKETKMQLEFFISLIEFLG